MLLNPEFWSILSSFATVLGFIVISISALVALRQLKEMKNARNLEAMLKVYEMIGSKDAHKARWYIHNRLTSDPESISSKEKEIIDEASTMYDRVGTLVKFGLVPEKYLLDSHYRVFMRMWEKLYPHIKHRRDKQGAPEHVHNFEAWANTCKNYHENLLKKSKKGLKKSRRAVIISGNQLEIDSHTHKTPEAN